MSDNPLLDLPELNGVGLSSATAISSLALNFALKWFDISMIKDGVMYQQKKMEGANITMIDLADVLDVARQFEMHIIAAPNRLSTIVLDAVVEGLLEEQGPDATSEDDLQDEPS